MALGFYFDMTSCIGCKTCQIACKDKNDLPIGTLYRNISSYETGKFPKPGAFHFSASCNHCEKPACVNYCPTGAMYKTEEGPVLHDDSICIGCQTCVQKCPYGVPKYLEGKNITGKCDTCVSIRANGNKPQCVAACPTRSLDFGEISELRKKYPDACLLTDLPFLPASDTVPSVLVKAKEIAKTEDAKKIEY